MDLEEIHGRIDKLYISITEGKLEYDEIKQELNMLFSLISLNLGQTEASESSEITFVLQELAKANTILKIVIEKYENIILEKNDYDAIIKLIGSQERTLKFLLQKYEDFVLTSHDKVNKSDIENLIIEANEIRMFVFNEKNRGQINGKSI